MQVPVQPLVKGYKHRIYPTPAQQQQLAKLLGSCRYVYNRMLSELIQSYEAHKADPALPKPKLSAFDLSMRLPLWKREEATKWLSESPAQTLQQSLHHLSHAYQSFFKTKKGYPRFKSKHGRQSATFTNQIYSIRDGKLILSKFEEPIEVRWSRELPSTNLKACTISKTSSGKYYVSILCEYIPVKTSGTGIIGIDAGITDLATLSTGITIVNIRSYLSYQTKLTRAQRALSRKKKGSSNRNKARLKVALIHEKIAAVRLDYLHKLTTSLVRENQAIAIESLSVVNMSKNRS